MPKIVTVIPARIGSTRFPNKPLHQIAGKELLAWVIEGAKKSKCSSAVIVATDDTRIFQLAERCGAEVVMTDSELPSGTDRVWAAVQSRDCDVVINVQGDEPLVTGELIDQLAEPFLNDPELKMATLAHKLDEADLANPNAVKVLLDQNRDSIYFSRFGIPFSRVDARHMRTSAVMKHIGMYGYRKSFLKSFCAAPQAEIERAEALEQLRALHLGVRIRIVPVNQRLIGVDTLEDAKRVEQLLSGGSIGAETKPIKEDKAD